MTDKQLMQMRTLNRYLTETKPLKMTEVCMMGLRKNLNKTASKDANLRKAMKFNLTRSQNYYIMLAAWNRLRPEE